MINVTTIDTVPQTPEPREVMPTGLDSLLTLAIGYTHARHHTAADHDDYYTAARSCTQRPCTYLSAAIDAAEQERAQRRALHTRLAFAQDRPWLTERADPQTGGTR